MYKLDVNYIKKLLNVFVICFFVIQSQAQDKQISIESFNQEEFIVKSLTGVPYTLIFENTSIDGQYHLASNGSLTFKIADMQGKKGMLRIVFEKEMHLRLENTLVGDYQKDVKWIESMLDIKEAEFKLFPSRPVFTDAEFDKLKSKVFEYTDTEIKEKYFYKWMEKVNYSVGVMRFFQDLYSASNGVENDQRAVFLPMNVYEELHK